MTIITGLGPRGWEYCGWLLALAGLSRDSASLQARVDQELRVVLELSVEAFKIVAD